MHHLLVSQKKFFYMFNFKLDTL